MQSYYLTAMLVFLASAAHAESPPAATDTSRRALDDVEHMDDRVFLPDDPAPDRGSPVADPIPLDSPPRVVGHAHLVAPHRLADVSDRDSLGAG